MSTTGIFGIFIFQILLGFDKRFKKHRIVFTVTDFPLMYNHLDLLVLFIHENRNKISKVWDSML